jgi:molecular chaperone HscA
MQDVADALEQCAEGEGVTLPEQKQQREALKRATEGLNQATTAFAGRRMDARVREALAGQRIDTLDVGHATPAPASTSAHVAA